MFSISLPTLRHAARRWHSTSALPIINLEDFHLAAPGSGAERAFLSQVKTAASTQGFFYLLGHGIDNDLFRSTFAHLERFFAQAEEEKLALHHSRTGNFRGYIGLFEQGDYGVDESSKERRGDTKGFPALMDFKEVFHVGPTLAREHRCYHELLFSENVWPQDIGFKEGVSQYYREVHELSDVMFQVFARCLDLERDFFKPLTDQGMNSMNMIHYPPLTDFPKGKEEMDMQRQLGIGEHTDFECFTLLAQHGVEEPCLDIWVDQRWMPVPPIPSAFVVNIGDMLSRWSNDLFQSTIHRARNHATKDRYSIAFFRAPNFDTMLTGLGPETGRPKYEPVSAGEHLLQRISKANEPVLQPTNEGSEH